VWETLLSQRPVRQGGQQPNYHLKDHTPNFPDSPVFCLLGKRERERESERERERERDCTLQSDYTLPFTSTVYYSLHGTDHLFLLFFIQKYCYYYNYYCYCYYMICHAIFKLEILLSSASSSS
jgi:hypothetical protein